MFWVAITIKLIFPNEKSATRLPNMTCEQIVSDKYLIPQPPRKIFIELL